MYQLADKNHIDLDEEVRAMARFTTARWDGVAHIETLFHQIARAAQHNAQSAITDYELVSYIMDQESVRDKALKAATGDSLVSFYDQPYLLFYSMESQARKLHTLGNDALYDAYSPTIKRFLKSLKGELAGLKKAKPKDLDELAKHYRRDDDVWEDALRREFLDKHAFEGADTGRGNHGGFCHRASTIFVVQTNETHRTAPIELLIEGAYSHLVLLCKHNNTQAILADLAQLSTALQAPHPVFTMHFEPQHKLTKALYALAKANWQGTYEGDPEQAYLEIKAACAKGKPLTEDEKKARLASGIGQVLAALKSGREPETAEARKAREDRNAREQQELQDILKTL